jgi:hypothetical protein
MSRELLARIREERRRRSLETDSDEIRERCKRLSGFIREAWPVIEPVDAYVHGWHIDVMAEHLEAVSRGEIKRLCINVPTGTMKSSEQTEEGQGTALAPSSADGDAVARLEEIHAMRTTNARMYFSDNIQSEERRSTSAATPRSRP